VLVLGLDLQLRSRGLLWAAGGQRSPRHLQAGGQRRNAGHLQEFQGDLHTLRRLAEEVPWLHTRLLLHEATMRMMAGASPARTQQLLDRSCSTPVTGPGLVCGKESRQASGGERERAAALVLGALHLPAALASPGERLGHLTQAAAILAAIGDRAGLQQVNRLMKQVTSSCPVG